MGLGSNIEQALLYLQRTTIGRTNNLTCSAVEATFTLARPGGYILTNMGPDPVNVQMFPAGAYTVTVNDFVLFPVGSGDRSEISIVVPPTYNTEYVPPRNVIHAICSAGKTANLRITHITEH